MAISDRPALARERRRHRDLMNRIFGRSLPGLRLLDGTPAHAIQRVSALSGMLYVLASAASGRSPGNWLVILGWPRS
jgi:hypothetical protein